MFGVNHIRARLQLADQGADKGDDGGAVGVPLLGGALGGDVGGERPSSRGSGSGDRVEVASVPGRVRPLAVLSQFTLLNSTFSSAIH